MIRTITIAILVTILVQPSFNQAPPAGDAPEQDCEDCTDILEGLWEAMGPNLEGEREMKMEGSKCEKCIISDLQTISNDGQSCNEKQPDESSKQTMRLQFENIHTVCDCEFENPDGTKSKGQIIADWKKARVITVLAIKENQCSVMSGSPNCDNPNPKCAITADMLESKCESEDENFVKTCGEKKDDILPGVYNNVCEAMFPKTASEIINENPEYVKKVNCAEEK